TGGKCTPSGFIANSSLSHLSGSLEMFHRKRTAVVAAALCWFSASKALAVAVDRTWLNTAGGSFQTPANWSGGVVPDADDTAIFDASSSSTAYSVTFTGNVV